MIKIAILPLAIVAYAVWGWPHAIVQAMRARRRLRHGDPMWIELRVGALRS